MKRKNDILRVPSPGHIAIVILIILFRKDEGKGLQQR